VKDALDIQPVRGASLVVRTTLEFIGEESRPSIVNHARVGLADGILRADQDDRYVPKTSPMLRHLRVVRVDCVKANLVLETERQDYSIDPLRELQSKCLDQLIHAHGTYHYSQRSREGSLLHGLASDGGDRRWSPSPLYYFLMPLIFLFQVF